MVVRSAGPSGRGRTWSVRARVVVWAIMAAAVFWTLVYQRAQNASDIPEFVYANF